MKKLVKNKKSEKFVTEATFHKHTDFVAVAFSKVYKQFEKIENKFEKIDERFEKIDERFEKIDERFERNEVVMLKMLESIDMIREDNKYIRKTVESFVHDISIHDRKIDGLTERVERLEQKTKSL